MTEPKDLSFKQYVDSKQQLRAAAEATPQRVAEYTVRSYCKIPVGESKESKTYIPLKPKYKIRVEWLYTDIDNPTPLSLQIEGTDSHPELLSEFMTFWSGSKLVKWLGRHTSENSSK